MEPEGTPKRLAGVQTSRPIFSALAIVTVIFGIPIVATLVASQFGLAYRLIGWTSLIAMMALTFQARFVLARLLLGERKLAPAVARRPFKRRR